MVQQYLDAVNRAKGTYEKEVRDARDAFIKFLVDGISEFQRNNATGYLGQHKKGFDGYFYRIADGSLFRKNYRVGAGPTANKAAPYIQCEIGDITFTDFGEGELLFFARNIESLRQGTSPEDTIPLYSTRPRQSNTIKRV